MALDNVHCAFVALCDSIKCLDGRRPVDLVNALGIDMKLAWKASRLMRAVSPAEILSELPGRLGQKKLIQACRDVGVPIELVTNLNEAVDQLDREIKELAGSRSLFEMMVIGLEVDKDTPLAVEQRRQFFNGARSVCGHQCEMNYRLDVLAPSTNPEFIDLATVRAAVGMVRFHASAPWRVRLSIVRDDRGDRVEPPGRTPLDPTPCDMTEAPLIQSLCEGGPKELPLIRSREEPNEFVLKEESVGASSRRTIAVGEILREAEPANATDAHHGFHQVMRLRTPAELAVFDVLMHRDLLPKSGRAQAIVYSDLYGERFASTYRESDRMPIKVELQEVGDQEAAGSNDKWLAAAMPELRTLISTQTGWSLDEFRHHRIMLPYPPLPASLVYEVELH